MDAGRGHRRVVPSPRPAEVVEWEAIRALVEAGVLTIATGGGGVPVVREEGGQGDPGKAAPHRVQRARCFAKKASSFVHASVAASAW